MEPCQQALRFEPLACTRQHAPASCKSFSMEKMSPSGMANTCMGTCEDAGRPPSLPTGHGRRQGAEHEREGGMYVMQGATKTKAAITLRSRAAPPNTYPTLRRSSPQPVLESSCSCRLPEFRERTLGLVQVTSMSKRLLRTQGMLLFVAVIKLQLQMLSRRCASNHTQLSTTRDALAKICNPSGRRNSCIEWSLPFVPLAKPVEADGGLRVA